MIGEKMFEKKNKTGLCFVGCFICIIVVRTFLSIKYGYASLLTDELVHWELGQSIFTNFQTNIENFPANRFDCLYSISIAIVHLFDSSEVQFVATRILNSLYMVSALIPIYLLGKKILGDIKRATFVTLLVSLLPEFVYCARIMQENLLLPITMWFFYIAYISFEADIISLRKVFALGVVAFICVWTKTVAIYVVLAVVFTFFLAAICERRIKEYVVRAAMFCVTFGGLFIGSKMLYQIINPGIIKSSEGSYIASQIGWSNLIFWIQGGLKYLVTISIALGPAMLLVTVIAFRYYNKQEKLFCQLVVSAIMFSIIESVGMFYIAEGMERVHIRYVFCMIPLIILLYAKSTIIMYNKKNDLNKLECCILNLYTILAIIVVERIGIFSTYGIVDGNSNRALTNNNVIIARWVSAEKYQIWLKVLIILYIISTLICILTHKYKQLFRKTLIIFVIMQLVNNYLCYAEEDRIKSYYVNGFARDYALLDEYIEENIKEEDTLAFCSKRYLADPLELHLSNHSCYFIDLDNCINDIEEDGSFKDNQITYTGWLQTVRGKAPEYIIINKTVNQEFNLESYVSVFESYNYRILKKQDEVLKLRDSWSGITADQWITGTDACLKIYTDKKPQNIILQFEALPGAFISIRDGIGKEKIYDLMECEGKVLYDISVDADQDSSLVLYMYGVKTIKPIEIFAGNTDERNLCAKLVSYQLEY